MASIILVEHPQQKKQSSSGGNDEQYQWHLYHEPVQANSYNTLIVIWYKERNYSGHLCIVSFVDNFS